MASRTICEIKSNQTQTLNQVLQLFFIQIFLQVDFTVLLPKLKFMDASLIIDFMIDLSSRVIKII